MMSGSNTNQRYTDPQVVRAIVDRLKSQGLFDQFRKECLADVDTKPAYQNLQKKVENYVNRFLSRQRWTPSLNKNQLRESLRQHLTDSAMLSSGVDRIIDQVLEPKVGSVFKPQVDKVVCEYLGIDPDERKERIKRMEQRKALKALAKEQRLKSLAYGHESAEEDMTTEEEDFNNKTYPPDLMSIDPLDTSNVVPTSSSIDQMPGNMSNFMGGMGPPGPFGMPAFPPGIPMLPPTGHFPGIGQIMGNVFGPVSTPDMNPSGGFTGEAPALPEAPPLPEENPPLPEDPEEEPKKKEKSKKKKVPTATLR